MRFALSVLVEWKSIDFQHMTSFELWLLLFLGIVLFRGIRLPSGAGLMTLLLFAMSLPHPRNAELLAFLAPLIAAPDAAPQLARARPLRHAAGIAHWLDRLARPATARGLAAGGRGRRRERSRCVRLSARARRPVHARCGSASGPRRMGSPDRV